MQVLFGQMRSPRLDDDRDLIVVAVNEPVEGHGRLALFSDFLAVREVRHGTAP
jgi:hypothetical protein